MVVDLLDGGADIDRLNEKQETPLILAAKLGRMKIFKHLVQAGKYFSLVG